ncbi:MAG: secretion protein HlyD [Alphaproteobacteria bacterium]|jgi:membrane fusion protein (multidrug efflux system)|nr:secretion protein HlyD [Alphaproteobacteria bacterium]PPR14411.1 MAG: putative multidrug resistance protein EmrK [Alphaproteobacteria bacterium MarineAlpha12_Bin1]|tara:strand:+ start:2547 stop:3725 length:1179 start_codon:yes stop_codon:yes gene_type:complete
MTEKATQEELLEDGGASKNEATSRFSFRRLMRSIVVLSIVVICLGFTGKWALDEWSKVTETDARIKTDQIAISSRIEGWVVKIPIKEGDNINTGDLLLEIDSREAKLKLKELDSKLLAIEARRQKILLETQMVDSLTKSRQEAALSRLKASEVAVKASREQRQLSLISFERAKRLIKNQAIPEQRLDQAKLEYSQSDERYQIAKADLLAAKADVREAAANRQKIKINKSLLDELKYSEAQIISEREQRILDIKDRHILSPIQGVVSRKFINEGEYLRRGQRLMLIHDPRNIWVEANIKETELRHLTLGMPVRISVDAFPDKMFIGQIENLGQAATGEFALLPNPNPSGNFTKITQRLPIRIGIKQKQNILRPGMLVVVEIDIPGRYRYLYDE